MRHIVEYALLVLGTGTLVLSALGVLAMRSVFDRLHYVGSASVGAAWVCIAVTVRESFSLIGNKALLVALILITSGPVLVQTTVRSFRIREHGDWRAGIDEAREEGEDR